MGDSFENQQVTAYQRIVKDYPLSIHAEDARAQLEVMKRTGSRGRYRWPWRA